MSARLMTAKAIAARERRALTAPTRACAQCGAEYLAINPLAKYCKPQCLWVTKPPHRYPARECPACGGSFAPTKNSQTVCSLKCRPHAGGNHTGGRPRLTPEILADRAVTKEIKSLKRRLAHLEACLATCRECSTPFLKPSPTDRRGFCKTACRTAWQAAHFAESMATRPPEPGELARQCRRCGEPFVSPIPHAVFCSPECSRRWHKCYSVSSRRKRKAMERVKRIRPTIFERDGWVCGICSFAIDRALPRNHPLAVTLDHIMPTSAGGSDDPENLQAAHRQCNVNKGDDLPMWWEGLAAKSARVRARMTMQASDV